MPALNEDEMEMTDIRPEDVEMFCTEEDVGTNVTICHDDPSDITMGDISI